MRRSGRKLAEVLATVIESVRVGGCTLELDEVAEKAIRDRGAIPSFKGYQPGPEFPPYPASICASPNETVVHGIPDARPLREGDILSIDVGLIYGGYHADCAVTVLVGSGSDEARQLVRVTEESLRRGILAARVGDRVGDIGHAVETYVADFKYGIVEAYVGHGIGRAMHEAPSVPNVGKKGKGQLLKAGMCLAIEPMITLGRARTEVLGDRWTVVTKDRSMAAHFEHTVVLTPSGPEVLTVLEGTGAF